MLAGTGQHDVEIIIPKLECNTMFSGDYRTKEEISGVMDATSIET